MKKNLFNEYDILGSVIVHTPNMEHDEVTPKNLNPEDKDNYLLFDDVLFMEKATEEHNSFTNIIKRFTGEKNCFQLMDLLKQTLSHSIIKKNFFSDMGFNDRFKDYEMVALSLTQAAPGENPLLNIMFTRDLGISIGNSMIITWASNKVRNPENIIAKYIIKNHKLFSGYNIYDFHENHPDLALEGGDVTLINEETIAIGISERTSKASVEAITPFLYKNGIKYIMCFNMPEERRFMHLDTVFSVINKNEAIVYPPFFETGNSQELDVDIITTSKSGPQSTASLKASSAFKKLNIDFDFIRCGGDQPHLSYNKNQEREQWTDGANAFCLSPGIIILYDRNSRTLMQLERHGYKTISADDFLALDNFDKKQKTVITIESGELSRGRGGPRCMTMPISRIK